MLKKLFHLIRENIRHQEVVLVAFFVGIGLVNIPFQHFMDLSRFQHYSFAIFSVALGFLIQVVISWRELTLWGRLALLCSSLYMASFGYTFWANPWLDFNVTLETELQTELRHQLAQYFAVGGIPLALLWSRWAVDRHRAAKKRVEAARETISP